ncbi:MAG: response regulator [Planctomycetota bacterium]
MNTVQRKPKLLVVDDEPDVRNMLLEILMMHDMEVTPAEDGSQALQEVARECFDLCVLDVAMPGLDGLEVCRRLRAIPFTRALPVLFLTAHQDAKTINDAFTVGATDYLIKPVHSTLLWVRVSNLLKMDELLRMTDQTREIISLLEGALKPRFNTTTLKSL